MHLSFSAVNRIIGLLILALGISLTPSIAVAAIYGEWIPFRAFLFTLFTSLAIGFVIIKFFKRAENDKKSHRDEFFVATVGYLTVSVIGTLPYMISGEVVNVVDALFESVSGFSTTGASIIQELENHSRSILFWRSFTQWLGGIGILIFAALRISGAAKKLCAIYISFTALETVFLLLGGFTAYDAVTYTFSTVSTGGFSVYSSSIGQFDGAYAYFVFSVFMLTGAVSSALYSSVLCRGLKEILKDAELKLYITVIFVSAVLLFINLMAGNTFDSMFDSVKYSAVQTVSIATTTGHIAADFNSWPLFCKMLLLSLMIMGGCSASIAGGMKVIRVLMVFKLIARGIFVRLHPNAFVSIKLYEKTLPGDVVSKAVYFVFLYIVIIFAGSILISLDKVDMTGSFSAVVSTLGNVGPMLCEAGLACDYSIFSYPSKLLLTFLMLAGRLELFAMIMLFVPGFWVPNR